MTDFFYLNPILVSNDLEDLNEISDQPITNDHASNTPEQAADFFYCSMMDDASNDDIQIVATDTAVSTKLQILLNYLLWT